MKLGAYFLPVAFDSFLHSVETADRVGYSNAWVCDSQMIWQDPYVYMARGLAATEKLVFGTAVTNPITRHPTVTASGHATLADMHPGRVVLGIGRGDSAIRTLGLSPARIRDMEAVVPRIRDLLDGKAVNFGERDVRITFAGKPVPIMLGGSGPRTMRLAGALADVVTLELSANPAAASWAIGNVHEGAREAGRDPASIEVVALCGMWVSGDRDEARAKTRWAPASAMNHLAEVMFNNPEHGMPPELTHLVELRRATVQAPTDDPTAGVPSLDGSYDYYGGHCVNDAPHAMWIPDEVIDDFTLSGDAETVLRKIEDLADVGVSQVAAAFLNDEQAQMERVGREVIPKIGSLLAARG